jgi:hypothetical protein
MLVRLVGERNGPASGWRLKGTGDGRLLGEGRKCSGEFETKVVFSQAGVRKNQNSKPVIPNQ